MISMTFAPPDPLRGLVAGSVSPICAAYRAWPISKRTCFGKPLRSLRDDPIHMTGFSVCSIIQQYVFCYKESKSTILSERFGRLTLPPLALFFRHEKPP